MIFIKANGLPLLDDPEGRIVTPSRVMAWEKAYERAVERADEGLDRLGSDAVIEALRRRGYRVEKDDSISAFEEDA